MTNDELYKEIQVIKNMLIDLQRAVNRLEDRPQPVTYPPQQPWQPDERLKKFNPFRDDIIWCTNKPATSEV